MKNKDFIAGGRVQMENVPTSLKQGKNSCVKRVNFTFFPQSKKSLQRQKSLHKNSTAPK